MLCGSNLELGYSPTLSLERSMAAAAGYVLLRYLVGIEQNGKGNLYVWVNLTLATRTWPRNPPCHGDEASD